MRTTLLMALVGLLAIVSLAGAASAPAFNAQQLRFFDDTETVQSVEVVGHNQNNLSPRSHCVPTTDYTTEMPGWWWAGRAYVHAYYSSKKCTGKSQTFTINIPTTFDGYYWRCVSNRSPQYREWSCD